MVCGNKIIKIYYEEKIKKKKLMKYFLRFARLKKKKKEAFSKLFPRHWLSEPRDKEILLSRRHQVMRKQGHMEKLRLLRAL